jgi:hypothetical protein
MYNYPGANISNNFYIFLYNGKNKIIPSLKFLWYIKAIQYNLWQNFMNLL